MARVKNKLADKPTGLRHRQEAAAGFSTAGNKKAKAPNKWKLQARNKPYNIRNATRRSMFFCKGFKFRWEQPIFEKMLDGSFVSITTMSCRPLSPHTVESSSNEHLFDTTEF